MKFKISGNNKRVAILISYISIAIQFLSTFIVTPFILKQIGSGDYGLFELISSTVSYLSLLGLGFSSAYIRFYSKYLSKNDIDGIKALNGLFLTIFMIMSVLCIVVGIILVINIEGLFKDGLSNLEYEKARFLMIILVFNMALTFPKSIFISNTLAHEHFVFQKLLALVLAIILPSLQIVMVVLGMGSLGLAIATIVVSVIDILSYLFYNIRFLRISFAFGHVDKALFKEIGAFTFFIFLNQVLDLLWGSSVDYYLLGRICGTEEVTIYSMGNKFNAIFYSLSTPISALFVPEINRIVAKGEDNKKLTDIFVKVGRYQSMVLILLFSGYVLWGKYFINFWIGEGYEDSYYVGVLLIGSVLVSLTQNIGIEIQRAKNKHQIRSMVYLAIAIGNVVLSIPLVKALGPVGAAIGTAIALILGTIVFMNIYYNYRLGINILDYWKMIGRLIIRILPSIAIGYVMTVLVKPNSLLVVLSEAFIFTIVYALCLFCWEFTKDEKKYIFKKANIKSGG